MTSLTCGLDKWEYHRETGEMGTAPIFNHFYNQKCGLDESSPYRRINSLKNGAWPHFSQNMFNYRICFTSFSGG